MAKRMCRVEGCGRSGKLARGLCNKHYMRWLRHGDPKIRLPRNWVRERSPDDFWSQTASEGACRIWTGSRDRWGYGQARWNGKRVAAHRLAFFLRMDRWPDGDLRHLCNNPPCVLHAVEGTRSENVRDSVAAGTHAHSRKTHCPQNHPYDEANTYLTPRDGYRQCRICRSERQRQRVRRGTMTV